MLRVFAILIFALHAVLPAGIRLTLLCAPCEMSCCAESGGCGCGDGCEGCGERESQAADECCSSCDESSSACAACECHGAADCVVSLIVGDCSQCCCCTQAGNPANKVIADKPCDLKRLLGLSDFGEDVGIEPFYSEALAPVATRVHALLRVGTDHPPPPDDPRRRQSLLCIWTI
jgi:hypothetical protein